MAVGTPVGFALGETALRVALGVANGDAPRAPNWEELVEALG